MSEPAFVERSPRVRFKHPVRVVPMDGGMPRAYRVLSANLSKDGMFLRMPNPPEVGTVVALSLEAGGRVLPFAQATVVWRDCQQAHGKPMGGFGVQFQNYLHPRSEELVAYLVNHLDTGKPLTLLGRPTSWTKLAVAATLVLLAGLGAVTYFMLGAPTGEEPALSAPPLVAVEAAPEPAAPAPRVEVVSALPDPNAPGPAEPAPAEAAPVPAPEVTPAPSPAPAKVAEAKPEPAPVKAAEVKHAPAEPVKVAEAKAAPPKAPEVNEKLEQAGPRPTKEVAARATTAAAVKEQKVNVGEAGMELPSGAAKSIEWTETPKQMAVFMRLKDGSRLVQAYRLGSPNRVVIELSGAAPDRSYTLRSPAITFNRVRIGRHGASTHIVLDLKKPASRVMKHGHTLTVTF